MILDFHTHIFPPEMIAARQHYAVRDRAFAELYEDPTARMATAEDLLESMNRAGIGASVVLGFAWSDIEDCRLHNDYLLQAAAASDGRLIPFCTVQPKAGKAAVAELERCAAGGALGIGEVRPQSQDYGLVDTKEGELLAAAAGRLGLVLLFHVSEPVGHTYPGKQGLALGEFAAFAARHSDLSIVGAHWAGGLPFFASMPEVRDLAGRVWFVTAATSLLYDPRVYAGVVASVGADRILFGSDFPLLSQKRSRGRIDGLDGLSEIDKARILGGNGCRLLGLE